MKIGPVERIEYSEILESFSEDISSLLEETAENEV